MSDTTVSDHTCGPLSLDERSLPTITLGFIPLTDCAVLAVASELGFAHRQGIVLRLSREVSWANIRDKVAFGLLDGAQMLAGMPIAATLGINQLRMPMLAPFCLSRNGNAITVSSGLYREMALAGGLRGNDAPCVVGHALRAVIDEHRTQGRPPLTFGMVYPFSCHNYELRYWMAACGIDPDIDVRLAVIPPPLMVDSLRDGYVDGFCVGEPWNSLAVEAGLGQIIVSKAEIWRHGVEKMLCVPYALAVEKPDILAALIRALDEAAAWADDPAHRSELVELLAMPAYLNAPAAIIERALNGAMVPARPLAARSVPDFLVLHREGANRPPVDQALWLYSQMVRWQQSACHRGDAQLVRQIFRPDVYEAALRGGAWQAPAPGQDWDVPESATAFDPTSSSVPHLDPGQIDIAAAVAAIAVADGASD
ncbi:MAG: ABC transporter substrate-binding protein [Rhodospirillales bacterium]|nr:ABC transporter substrate-binding protein [Rhodospirillales bacterium]